MDTRMEDDIAQMPPALRVALGVQPEQPPQQVAYSARFAPAYDVAASAHTRSVRARAAAAAGALRCRMRCPRAR
jgi:hypothetical protein